MNFPITTSTTEGLKEFFQLW